MGRYSPEQPTGTLLMKVRLAACPLYASNSLQLTVYLWHSGAVQSSCTGHMPDPLTTLFVSWS
jgi:hypothetical protein